MEIIAIDTNVVLGYLLGRPSQFEKAKILFEKCRLGEISLLIPFPVFLETEWVLRSYYKLSKSEILGFFKELILLEHLNTDRKLLDKTITIYENYTISITDAAVLALIMESKSDRFVSFDKKLLTIYRKFCNRSKTTS
jgi:predicted nucleic acid-binding protein